MKEKPGSLLPGFYTTAKVWRTYEVLWELRSKGLVPDDVIFTYQEETKHKFPQGDLQKWRSYRR